MVNLGWMSLLSLAKHMRNHRTAKQNRSKAGTPGSLARLFVLAEDLISRMKVGMKPSEARPLGSVTSSRYITKKN